MLRFSVGGEYIDLYEDTSLTFKKKNILFAFDNIECERSASFSIPATPKNDKVFSISRWLNTDGAGMRRRYDAQLQAAAVTKDGYLYIDSFDGRNYKAIFVTGELLGLKVIRDFGNIDKSGVFDDYKNAVIASPNTGVAASTANNRLWENVAYQHDAADPLRPSISIAQMLAAFTITDPDGIINSLNLRWIPKSMKEVQDSELTYILNIVGGHSSGYVPIAQTASNVSETELEQAIATEYFISNVFIQGGARVLVKYASGGSEYHGYVTQLKTIYDTTIHFSANMPNDMFLGYFNQQTGSGQDYALLSDFHFLGGYEFDTQGTSTGTPLAGRAVTLPAGTTFCIIRKAWWSSAGWNITSPDYTVYFNYATFGNFEDNIPAIWRLKDNLPECTVTDILKAIAAITGRVLYYSPQTGVRFLSGILDGDVKELTGLVIESGSASRKFSDYAQNNLVNFAEDGGQFAYEIDGVNYTIQNANIAEQKVLQTLPAGNGGLYEDHGTYETLLVREGEECNIFARYDTQDTIYLSRVGLQKNADIQTLCDASTSTQIRARMTLLEFELLTPRTRLSYDGINYVWTEAQWNKGVATLKLSKT